LTTFEMQSGRGKFGNALLAPEGAAIERSAMTQIRVMLDLECPLLVCQSGKHMFALSFSGFGPEADILR
jgi:hypothetical protein